MYTVRIRQTCCCTL